MKKILLLTLIMALLFSGCSQYPSVNQLNANSFKNTTLNANITSPLDLNRVAVNDIDFFYRASLGLIPGTSSIFKFGSNENLGTTEEVIWDGGGNYIFLTSAEQLNIQSTSNDDTYGGDGAWNIIVFGLDENFNQISEIVNLTGTTPVTTQQSFIRTFRAIVLKSGNPIAIENSNLGTISIESSTTNTLQAQINEHNGQTLMAVYTIPEGYIGLATGLSFNVGQGKETSFKAKFRNGADPNSAFSVKYKLTVYESTVFADLKTPLCVPEKTDIVITGQLSSTPEVETDGSFGLLLVNKTDAANYFGVSEITCN